MKLQLKTIRWKFCESELSIPYATQKDAIISTPADAYKLFHPIFTGAVRERFLVIWLSSANKVAGYEIVSEGILNSSLAHPREVFRGAIVATCASIIICHNHPSGNTEPSSEDVQITRQMAEAGKIIGIPVHDHIIFSDTTYTSLAERGLL
jgi:DNA repair protein RadC